ncbi:MAG: DUF2188 domain-containing protein [Candidatus Izemoplasmatales bacterium]
MIQFIQDYYLFIITVGGTILALVTAYFIYNYRYHKLAPKIENDSNDQSGQLSKSITNSFDSYEPTLEEAKTFSSPTTNASVAPQIEEKMELNTEESVVESAPLAEPIDEKSSTLDTEDSVEHNLPDMNSEENEQEEEIQKPEKKLLGKYHIVFRQDDQMWVVKREGSDKIIRALHTQKEAIAYATIKALSQDTTFVIHKKDGKIRKQNYTKKTK